MFIDGVFHSQLGDALKTGSVLVFDCFPPLDPSPDGTLKLKITVSCDKNCQTFEWNLRSQISNVYFGMQFNHQGTRIKVEWKME